MFGEEIGIEVIAFFQGLQVYFENLFPFANIRKVDVDLAVETSGAHQCFVENVGAVGRGKYDYGGIRAKTVHFGQELVERILAFVVTTGEVVASARPSLLHRSRR